MMLHRRLSVSEVRGQVPGDRTTQHHCGNSWAPGASPATCLPDHLHTTILGHWRPHESNSACPKGAGCLFDSHSQRETSYTAHWSANAIGSSLKQVQSQLLLTTPHTTTPLSHRLLAVLLVPLPLCSLASPHPTLNTAAVRSPEKLKSEEVLLCSNPCNALPGHCKQMPKSYRSGPPCRPTPSGSHAPWPHSCGGKAATGPPHPPVSPLRAGSPDFLRSSLQWDLREPPAPPALFKITTTPFCFSYSTYQTRPIPQFTILSLLPQRE